MGKPKGREMLFWTKAEYLKFAEAMMDKPLSYYAFEMLYWCGVREGELLALTPGDFDFEKQTVTISKSYQRIKGKDVITDPKTPKSNRVIQMPAFLCEEMRDYIKSLYGVKPTDRIFTVTKSYLHREMDRGAKEAGVKRIRIHDLRHSHISLLIDMGFTALAIADRVGHESIDITPHLHIDFVPFTTGSKRGLDTRVSLKQALAAQGFQGGTRGDTEWSQWVRSEKEQLSLVMERHGIEWEDKGTHDKHLSVLDYKKEQRAKEIAVLETVKAEKENQVESQERRLKELAPAVKNMERLAADFSANPEEILPEPGTLETGRAYREKKAKPLLAQIVKVLRSLYLAYVELRGKFERLQGDYGRVRESNIRLSDRLQEVKLENKAMRQVSADYERVKRAFGPEQVDRILEAAYQQEHAEKERKRAAKSKIRIDAR